MIVKPSTRAAEVQEANALVHTSEFQRLGERDRKAAFSIRKGWEGEAYVAHILDRHFHASSDHAVLHDLRIPDGIGGHAQIEHVIFSRLSRKAAIVEVKFFGGTLSRNAHDEWMLWYRGQRRPQPIANPLAQARRQREVLKAWLRQKQHDKAFETVGVFVALPPECDIDRKKISGDLSVFKADNLIQEWIPFGGVSPLGKMFSVGVSSATLRAVGEQLAKADEPLGMTVRQQLRLAPWTTLHDNEQEASLNEAVLQAEQSELEGEKETEIVAAVEHEPLAPPSGEPSAPNLTHEAPETIGLQRGKAGPRVQIVPGIYERQLPDNRVAFSAAKDDLEAAERLTSVCEGKARWNRVFGNWLADRHTASSIKELLIGTGPGNPSIAVGSI
jgi:hypothetical protein